jgi:dTDP-4-amino-4,6-dideoxygalactose transaminase
MIPPNDFCRQWDDTREEAVASFIGVGQRGYYILGQRLDDFAKSLAGYWGVPYAAGVANGMEALQTELTALGCRPGDIDVCNMWKS